MDRAKTWAIRCTHEASLHKFNCYLTLTYSDSNLPSDGSLNYRDFQLFMKRFRKMFPDDTIRFYMCGEYGDKTERPHYHALIFGFDFPDKKFLKVSRGNTLFVSKTLDSLWGLGHCFIGAVSFQSAAYVARYVMKKQTGKNAEDYYRRVHPETGEIVDLVPEFNKMSLRPGIGGDWIEKYPASVYPHDFVVHNGREYKPPRFYDTRYEKQSEESAIELESIRHARYLRGVANSDENTPERLAVREACLVAKLKRLKRNDH